MNNNICRKLELNQYLNLTRNLFYQLNYFGYKLYILNRAATAFHMPYSLNPWSQLMHIVLVLIEQILFSIKYRTNNYSGSKRIKICIFSLFIIVLALINTDQSIFANRTYNLIAILCLGRELNSHIYIFRIALWPLSNRGCTGLSYWRKIDSNYHFLYCKYNWLPIIIFPLLKLGHIFLFTLFD